MCEKLGFPSPRWLLPLLWPDDMTKWIAYYNIVNERTGTEEEVLPAEALRGHLLGIGQAEAG